MNIFLYIIIFIMGTVFGSFYTLAVYRLPKKIDIIHTHSFCPNCNHKLGFFELIPVLSYIILGGKCKECGKRIRPRYFILEILSGLVFILIAYGLKIDVYNLQINTIIRFGFLILYLVSIFIISGIDKEYRKIVKTKSYTVKTNKKTYVWKNKNKLLKESYITGVLYYGITVSCAYIIYLCIMDETSIYRYVMYLVTLIILLITDSQYQIKNANPSYALEVLVLIVIMLINTGEFVTVLSVVIVLLAISIAKIIYYIRNALNKSRKEYKKLTEIYKFGYLLAISNIMLFIGQLIYNNIILLR